MQSWGKGSLNPHGWPVAAVGLSEAEAREQGLKFRVKKEITSSWYSSRRVAEKYSGYKVAFLARIFWVGKQAK